MTPRSKSLRINVSRDKGSKGDQTNSQSRPNNLSGTSKRSNPSSNDQTASKKGRPSTTSPVSMETLDESSFAQAAASDDLVRNENLSITTATASNAGSNENLKLELSRAWEPSGS